ncbi:MAG: hypothetical protein ACLFO6_07725 [Archaeoglobaceae archaeon]
MGKNLSIYRYGPLLTFLLFLISLSFIPVSAQEHVEGYGQICYPCHDILLTKDERVEKLAHCRCHSVDIWRSGGDKIDMEKLSELHGDSPCIKCHVGSTAGTEMNFSNVHDAHKNVKCEGCHGSGTMTIPESDECLDCHQGGVHTAHEDVLIDVCEGCHGEVINKYAELRSEVGITPTPTPKDTDRSVFSLFDLIQRIISFFTGGL